MGFSLFHFRPEILKHEMKVFFVKYNDPIYVKLEKLDIMIRLASQANIAQVKDEMAQVEIWTFLMHLKYLFDILICSQSATQMLLFQIIWLYRIYIYTC